MEAAGGAAGTVTAATGALGPVLAGGAAGTVTAATGALGPVLAGGAAGTVTAATGALGPVLAKLTALLGDQCTPDLEGSQGDIKFIVSKLESVHSLLLRIWEREDHEAAFTDWMAEARKLSYDIEDDIDGFMLGLEHGGEISTSLFERIKLQVEELVSRLCEEWVNFDQTVISNRSEPPLVDPRSRFLHKDEAELVEMDEKKAELTKLLQEHEMVCIHGFAGMGKTTLADLVCQAIGEKFQCRAFVSVSPRPDMTQILITILSQLTADHVPSASTETAPADKREVDDSAQLADTDASKERYIIDTTSTFLTDKRYLIIVDDVWQSEQWEVIRECLPKNNNLGCRIIITTRVNAVADKFRADNHAFVYKIGGLSMDAAEALSERIFKESCKVDTVPSDMHNTYSSIAKMSGGMPLAVICMSAAVAEQLKPEEGQEVDPDTAAYSHFRLAKIRALEGFTTIPCLKPLVESFSLGYNGLPLHLKTCLLHCSMYPPYHILQMDDLTRMWIAEGFVHGEEEARSYADELVYMGLICQCSSDLVPALKYEMNVMMLHFLRCKSRENYVVASSDCGSDVSSPPGRRIRRLSIQSYQNKQDTSWLHVSDTRSLYVFCYSWRAHLNQFERLRVLHLHGNHLGNDDLVKICGLLIRLRCLSVKGALINQLPTQIVRLQYLKILNVSNTGILHLPREIGELQRLKTLDASNTMVVELPGEIGRLQHLKTLDLRNSSVRKVPREIGELQDLETLYVSNTMIEELPKEIGKLQLLKTLSTRDTRVRELPGEIGELKHLEMLDVSSTMIAELPREIGALQRLKVLNICNTGVRELPWEAGLRLRSSCVLVLVGDHDSPKKVKLFGLWQALEVELPECAEELSIMCQEFLEEDDRLCLPGCAEDHPTTQASIVLFDRFGSRREPLPFARYKVTNRHMSVPQCIQDNFSHVSSMEISLWKLDENNLMFLQKMPYLQALALRVEVLPRKTISIGKGGFPRLESLCIDCRVPRVPFEEGAMPELKYLEFKFYACRGTKDPVGISHFQSLQRVVFRSASWYKSDAPGISAIIEKVREEAMNHRNRITLCINDKEEVLPEKKGATADTKEDDSSTNGAGNSGADAIKPSLVSHYKKEEASQVSNSASCSRTSEIQEVHD